MSISLIEEYVQKYAISLKDTEIITCVDEDAVLAILNARDHLAAALQTESGITPDILKRVIDLDRLLRQKAPFLNQNLKSERFAEWRESLNPPSDAWWWWLDNFAPVHPLDRLDNLWNLISVVCWSVNISLLVNIASRFLSSGVGLVGVATVALPSVLALLQIGGEFTKAGREEFEKMLVSLKIPKEWQQEVKLAISLLFSLALCTLWLKLPDISKIYLREGVIKFNENKLSDAEQNFSMALSLDNGNPDIHYNLASLYESLGQDENAVKSYLLALPSGLPDVYNNLARMYIKEEKYGEAVNLLLQGLDKIKDTPPDELDNLLVYNLNKNLGWARFQQERYEEAQKYLTVAISVAKTSGGVRDKVKPGFAYCMLAQVKEKLESPALANWRKCEELASNSNPDEDPLLYQAQQKLQKEKEKSDESKLPQS